MLLAFFLSVLVVLVVFDQPLSYGRQPHVSILLLPYHYLKKLFRFAILIFCPLAKGWWIYLGAFGVLFFFCFFFLFFLCFFFSSSFQCFWLFFSFC